MYKFQFTCVNIVDITCNNKPNIEKKNLFNQSAVLPNDKGKV